jgi:ferritin-like metal-binding protein YciE
MTAMAMETLRDLLVHELKDLYSAEKQLTKALPKMAKAATNESLQEAFSAAMEGLIEEAQKVMKDATDDAVLDAALIAEAQRVEHYEMAGYGCARAYAEQLGENEIADLLQTTLDEESAANEKLNDIALNEVNAAAMEAGEMEEEEAEV